MAELIMAVHLIIMGILDAIRRELYGMIGAPLERLEIEEKPDATDR